MAEKTSGQPDGSQRSVLGEWPKSIDFETSLVWAFKVAPSGLPSVLWTHSYNDLKVVVDLKLQLELTRSLDAKANFQQVLGDALKAVFGSKEGSETKVGAAPTSYEELDAILARMS